MHEWALATGVVSSLLDYTRSRGGVRIISATVKVGTLSMIDPKIMEEALATISKGTEIEGIKFNVEGAETRFTCMRCSTDWTFKDVEEQVRASVPRDLLISDESGEKDMPMHYFPELVYAWMRCPKCGSRDYRMTSASGVILEKVEVEE